MAYAELKSTEMAGELLGKRQRLAHSARHPLSQRMIATLDMVGGAGHLTARSVWRGGHDACVHHRRLGGKRGVLPGGSRNLGPYALGTLAAPIPHMKGDPLAAPGVHGKPNPLLMPLLRHAARHCIRRHRQPLPHHGAVPGHGWGVERLRPCLGALAQKTHEPLQSNTHRCDICPATPAAQAASVQSAPVWHERRGMARSLRPTAVHSRGHAAAVCRDA